MGLAVRTLPPVPRTQIIPKWPGTPSGPYGLFRPQMTSQPSVPFSWTSAHPFPPSPPSIPPPPSIPRIPPTQASICTPTQPCPSTLHVHISPSQRTSGPLQDLSHDPILHHNRRQKLGFMALISMNIGKPTRTTIRSSAFTQKLDIEGCDPLALPLAALLYQQANNHWLRKLAHGGEMYLIPTGDIAAVVFTTELLSQLRNCAVDLDRVAMVRARQDGKTMDKSSNTKHMAQVIAQQMQGWLPIRSIDPDSQHEITQLRHQLAELRQRIRE